MPALVLDAGALVAVDRGDRVVHARLRRAVDHGYDVRTNAVVVAQVWRDARGRQAGLARLLRDVDVRSVDEAAGRAAGLLLATASTSDAVDATVVVLAQPGDRIVTSDPADIQHLLDAAGKSVELVVC